MVTVPSVYITGPGGKGWPLERLATIHNRDLILLYTDVDALK
jgi:hypothetical protein